MNKTNFSYKDIAFVESGAIVKLDKEKEELKFLSPNIHIMGFNNVDKTLITVCLEFGIIADGRDKKEARNRILTLTEDFLLNNTKQIIEKILISNNMDNYWALYRLYEKRNIPKKIKINKKILEQKNEIEIDKLVEDYKKLQHKLDQANNIIEYLLIENNKLQSNNKSSKSLSISTPILIPSGENIQWAIEQ